MRTKIEQVRWTVNAAATEFGTTRETLSRRLAAAGITAGADEKYSTKEIHKALCGDEQMRKAKLSKLEHETKAIVLQNKEYADEIERGIKAKVQQAVESFFDQLGTVIVSARGLHALEVHQINGLMQNLWWKACGSKVRMDMEGYRKADWTEPEGVSYSERMELEALVKISQEQLDLEWLIMERGRKDHLSRRIDEHLEEMRAYEEQNTREWEEERRKRDSVDNPQLLDPANRAEKNKNAV
jgi:hypothetical protein